MYYKLRQACFTNWGRFVLLQIRGNVVINWGDLVSTNWGKPCFKLGQLLQIRLTFIKIQSSYYKLGQNVLQIGAGITNQINYYKFGPNNHQNQLNYIGLKLLQLRQGLTHFLRFFFCVLFFLCCQIISLFQGFLILAYMHLLF